MQIVVNIEKKHALVIAGLLLLLITITSAPYVKALTQHEVMQRSPAYHLLKDIYTQISGEYVPLATTSGKINASLIEGKVAETSQSDYALNADKLDGKDWSSIGTCPAGRVLQGFDSSGSPVCVTDQAGISSCSDCASIFVNRSGDTMSGDLNMQDRNLRDANIVEANIIRDPEDSWVIISDSLRANDIKIINKKNCNKLYTDSYGNVKCGTDQDTRCDTPGRCSQLCIGDDCRSSWPSGGVGDDVLQSFPKICYATDLDTGKVYVNLPGCAESYPLSNNLLYNAQVTAKTSWWGGFSADMGCTGHVNQPKRVVDASLSTCWSVGYGYYYDPDRSGEVLKVDAGGVITAQLDVKFAVKSGVCSTSKWCYGHVEISSDGSHWYRLATLGSNNCKYEVGKYNFGSRTFRYVRFVAGSGYICEMQIYEVLAWG